VDTEPDAAFTVTTAVLSFDAAVPDSVAVPSPLSWNVRPLNLAGSVADSRTPDVTPDVAMVTEWAVPGTNVAEADEVMASTCTVRDCAVSGPIPLFACRENVYAPPVNGPVPDSLAVPAEALAPYFTVIHDGIPDAVNVGFGVPEVVTVNLRGLPAAMVTEPGEVMMAVFDEGMTLLDGADAAPVPLALAAVTVKVTGAPLLSPVTTHGEAADAQV
jgi:hypothetical protein